jgi:nucleotide-binding universal stress UspA family protein
LTVVLTPIDGSARALRAVPWAARLAGRGGTVVLLRAIPPRPAYAEALLRIAGDTEEGIRGIEDAWVATAQADIDEAAQMVDEPGVAVEQMIAEGDPDEAIVAAVDRRGADMIAMASHGRGAIGRALFGSVADRVARSATVPVLILRTPDDVAVDDAVVTRIVVPYDGSELAARALPIASEMAKTLDVPVHIVRAVDPVTSMPVAPGVLGPAPAGNAQITERIWQEAESEARASVRDLVARLDADGIETSGAVLTGSPFFAISEATQPGDLLVLTSHGRGGVRRWLLGSVAEKLVREAPVPVVLVPAVERETELRRLDG